MSLEETPGPLGRTTTFVATQDLLPKIGLEPVRSVSSVWRCDISSIPSAGPETPRKILVVEDEATLAAMLAMVLEDEGFSVRIARDGLEGLELFAGERPDLIVTDYMMPRMDGTALIARLRADGETLPIIMASAVASRQMAAAQDLAVNAFLMKPYRDSQLIGLIRELLGNAQNPTPAAHIEGGARSPSG